MSVGASEVTPHGEPRAPAELSTAPAAIGPARTLPYALAMVAVALTYLTVDSVAPALPAMQDDLALSAAGAGLIFSLLFAGRLVANVPAAWLLDRAGAAATAAIGGALLAVGSAAAALASSSELVMGSRFVQGAGVAFLVNASLRSILASKPGDGAAMTYFGLAATVGGVVGLQLGGFLTEWQTWRAIFVVAAVVATGMTLAAMASGARAARSRSLPTDAVAATAEAATPLRQLLPWLTLNFLVFANYSVWVALPLYAERTFGTTAETNANLLLMITVVHLIAAFPVARLISRWGSPRVLAIGIVVALSGTLLILMPNEPWAIGLPLILYGAGQVAAVNAGGDIVLQQGGRGSRAIGLLRLSSDLGLVIGPIVTGALADALGYGSPFIGLPVMMLGAAAFALWRAASERAANG